MPTHTHTMTAQTRQQKTPDYAFGRCAPFNRATSTARPSTPSNSKPRGGGGGAGAPLALRGRLYPHMRLQPGLGLGHPAQTRRHALPCDRRRRVPHRLPPECGGRTAARARGAGKTMPGPGPGGRGTARRSRDHRPSLQRRRALATRRGGEGAGRRAFLWGRGACDAGSGGCSGRGGFVGRGCPRRRFRHVWRGGSRTACVQGKGRGGRSAWRPHGGIVEYTWCPGPLWTAPRAYERGLPASPIRPHCNNGTDTEERPAGAGKLGETWGGGHLAPSLQYHCKMWCKFPEMGQEQARTVIAGRRVRRAFGR